MLSDTFKCSCSLDTSIAKTWRRSKRRCCYRCLAHDCQDDDRFYRTKVSMRKIQLFFVHCFGSSRCFWTMVRMVVGYDPPTLVQLNNRQWLFAVNCLRHDDIVRFNSQYQKFHYRKHLNFFIGILQFTWLGHRFVGDSIEKYWKKDEKKMKEICVCCSISPQLWPLLFVPFTSSRQQCRSKFCLFIVSDAKAERNARDDRSMRMPDICSWRNCIWQLSRLEPEKVHAHIVKSIWHETFRWADEFRFN